jgi:polyisoprenoid-binding protein YceI
MATVSEATAVPTGTWTVDPIHSVATFSVRHMVVGTFRGEFGELDATLNDGRLVGRVKVASLEIKEERLKGHLLSPDFFDAERTPTVVFRSNDIRIAAGGDVEVDGELTIRGITKPVTATGTIAYGTGISGAEVVGFDLEAEIDRREYGLNWQAELPKGGDVLGWDVVLEVHLELPQA